MASIHAGELVGEVVRGVPAACAMRALHRAKAMVHHGERRHAPTGVQLQHHGEGEGDRGVEVCGWVSGLLIFAFSFVVFSDEFQPSFS